MLAFGITQTRNAKPVFGSGSARIDKAPLGAFKRKRSCLAVSVGVMCLAVVPGDSLQRLLGKEQNPLSRPAPRQALADLAVGLVASQQLVGHFAAVITAHQHADQG